MSREREVRTEKGFWGNEREIIYEDGQRVGDYRLEERGGIGGWGGETVKSEYNNTGDRVGYTRKEQQGGILGFLTTDVEVGYNIDGKKLGYSKVEERGGIAGMLTHHERVGYDTDGKETSSTHSEKRGGLLGVGSTRTRVTRYSDAPVSKSRSYGRTVAGSGSGTADGDLFGALVGGAIFLAGIAALISLVGPLSESRGRPSPVFVAPVEDFSPPAPVTFSPSFDCQRATRWAELFVCGSEAMAGADRELADIYTTALDVAPAADRLELIESQRSWIRERDACEMAAVPDLCIAAVYQERIERLKLDALVSMALAPDPEGTTELGALPPQGAPSGAGPLFIEFDTPDGAALDRTEKIIRSVPGVRGLAVKSLALGGVSLLQVTYGGTELTFADELGRRGIQVTVEENVLRLE